MLAVIARGVVLQTTLADFISGWWMTDCDHTHNRDTRRLFFAFIVISAFMVVEVVGGVLSGSLALLADAVHMMTDALALGLALSAQWFARRPPDKRLHFGYQRGQVLAAFVNGVLLMILLAWIVIEAVQRFVSPEPVAWRPMLVVAVIGLLANGLAFWILHASERTNINVRGAMLHVISDLFGSVAAVMAALVIAGTGWLRVDPLLSLAVAALIARSAGRLLHETGHILLEGAPKDIDPIEVAGALEQISPDVEDVHSVQIWQIKPGTPRIILHARVNEQADGAAVLADVKSVLTKNFGIEDSTIQIEYGACPDCQPGGAAATSHGTASVPSDRPVGENQAALSL